VDAQRASFPARKLGCGRQLRPLRLWQRRPMTRGLSFPPAFPRLLRQSLWERCRPHTGASRTCLAQANPAGLTRSWAVDSPAEAERFRAPGSRCQPCQAGLCPWAMPLCDAPVRPEWPHDPFVCIRGILGTAGPGRRWARAARWRGRDTRRYRARTCSSRQLTRARAPDPHAHVPDPHERS
jgi:hypothetical protein